MTASIFHALAEAARNGESVALGVISGVSGSSPQKVGAKALFHAGGGLQGTLGGGCLEAEAQRLAVEHYAPIFLSSACASDLGGSLGVNGACR